MYGFFLLNLLHGQTKNLSMDVQRISELERIFIIWFIVVEYQTIIYS